MNRPEIVALVAAGHTDAGIAARLGIHRSTAHRVRQELRSGSPQARALESVPTGLALKRREWTPAEQARHRAELLAALDDSAA